MKHFRKIWDKEKDDFIMQNKTLKIKEQYRLFCEKFPTADVSLTAFNNERARIGAVFFTAKHPSTKVRPVGSEHTKKGYVCVKVGQPNEWKFKHHCIWEQAHPGQTVQAKTETVIFLDLDRYNFAPENLHKTKRRCMARINSGKYGNLRQGDPEGNLIIIKQAELEIIMFDRAESLGLISYKNNGRCFTEQYREKARNYSREYYQNMTPEQIERKKQQNREYMARKRQDPEWVKQQKIRYKRWWDKKKAAEKKEL